MTKSLKDPTTITASPGGVQGWRRLYTGSLEDLGSQNEQLKGILSPGYSSDLVSSYVQWQFLECAEELAARIESISYTRHLLATAMERIGWPVAGPVRILDLGSGAGNTIIPLLELCPDAELLATDLSVKMLAVLRRMLAERGWLDRCTLMELNAESLDFLPESCDLVTGGAILHHLHRPDLCLEGCSRVLKKDGWAVFFEPFENGNGILAVAMERILDDPRAGELPPEIVRHFRLFKDDYHLRKGRDKSDPRFHLLDDKWCFTKSYFADALRGCDFRQCIIYPLHETRTQFQRQMETQLRLGAGRPPEDLPPWAWEMVRQYDRFSEDMKADLLIEGCILLRK
jgi:ubiquinone/menaquinone biosynthesis C-methylase UbiE